MIRVLSHDKYYSQFYRPFCKLVKYWSPSNYQTIFLYFKEIGVFVKPHDTLMRLLPLKSVLLAYEQLNGVYFVTFAKAVSNSRKLGSGTNGSIVCTSICLTPLTL
jgi:hypothetical protein